MEVFPDLLEPIIKIFGAELEMATSGLISVFFELSSSSMS
jgi:hypothetical protein